MQDFIDAIVFGFKEILNFKKLRLAIISGTIISILWIFIAIFFWEQIVSFSATFIDLVPFSMIRSNGAWMLSSFLWLQLVLITFAFVFIFVVNIALSNAVVKEKYGILSISIILSSATFWSVVWYFKGNYIHIQASKLLTWLPFETIEKSISYLIGFYFIYNLIILTNIFLTSSFSHNLLISIRDKYFPYDTIIEDSEIKTIKYTLRDTSIFILLSILAFPLLFIPVLNFIVQILLWTWLIKDTSAYDSASLLIKDINKDKLKEHKIAIWGISFLSVLFNFIPVFNIFGPYFSEISMFYYFKEQNKQ